MAEMCFILTTAENVDVVNCILYDSNTIFLSWDKKPEPLKYNGSGIFCIIPTRSCKSDSKQFCLEDLAQVIRNPSIIQ